MIVSAIIALVSYEMSVVFKLPWLNPRPLLAKLGLTGIDLQHLLSKLRGP